ncbi:MAG: hypothetical protein ACI9UJ_000100 [bacterium]|jgi:uncharacterized protein YigE (DUF2233 family)
MERRSKLARFLPIVGFGLLVGISVFVWANKSSGHAETITFKDQIFEVFTVKDIENIEFGYRDSAGKPLRNFKNFRAHMSRQSKPLLMAVNGGMFTKEFTPQGLYVDQGVELNKIRLDSGYGNFYLKPNGDFAITVQSKPVIEESSIYADTYPLNVIQCATQSGPLLVINDSVHPAFQEGSKNKHIRNGVGINSKGEVVFVISNEKVNFYDFATLFRDQLNCSDALYLDGAISKMYNSESKLNEDGSFGVMIGVVKPEL